MKNNNAPGIYWTATARRRFWAFVDSMKTEVGGFGFARLEPCKNGPPDIVWHETFIVPQIVTKGEVDYSTDGVAFAINKAAEEGYLGNPDFVWVSWHSHNDMDVFWSGTDEDCIHKYGTAGMPLVLSIVGNHKHEYRCRLDYFGVEHHGIPIGQVTTSDLVLELELTDEFENGILAEVKEFVKEKWTYVRKDDWRKDDWRKDESWRKDGYSLKDSTKSTKDTDSTKDKTPQKALPAGPKSPTTLQGALEAVDRGIEGKHTLWWGGIEWDLNDPEDVQMLSDFRDQMV